MTAQEQGLMTIGGLVRKLVPPQLDFVVIVYPGPDCGVPLVAGKLSWVTSDTFENVERQMNKRAVDAAAIFVAEHKGDAKPVGGN